MLVELDDKVSVNPDYVASIRINSDLDVVVVMMHDGEKIIVCHDYNCSVWQTADRIRGLING